MKDPVRVKKRSRDSKSKMLKGVSFQFYIPCSGSRKTWSGGYRYNEVGLRIVRNR